LSQLSAVLAPGKLYLMPQAVTKGENRIELKPQVRAVGDIHFGLLGQHEFFCGSLYNTVSVFRHYKKGLSRFFHSISPRRKLRSASEVRLSPILYPISDLRDITVTFSTFQEDQRRLEPQNMPLLEQFEHFFGTDCWPCCVTAVFTLPEARVSAGDDTDINRQETCATEDASMAPNIILIVALLLHACSKSSHAPWAPGVVAAQLLGASDTLQDWPGSLSASRPAVPARRQA
jgi:hypothetical protein